MSLPPAQSGRNNFAQNALETSNDCAALRGADGAARLPYQTPGFAAALPPNPAARVGLLESCDALSRDARL
jgi:hypothetical protein